MTIPTKAIHASQRGAAAVELAMILGFTFFVLPVAFLFGRVLYHYSVLKQATQDSAMYMATLPLIESSSSAGMTAAKARARQMVIDAIAAAGMTPPEDLELVVTCDGGGGCSSVVQPGEYTVWARYTIYDGLAYYTDVYLPDSDGGSYSWSFVASSTVRNLN